MPSERIAIHHIAGILRLRHEAGRSPAGDRQRLRNGAEQRAEGAGAPRRRGGAGRCQSKRPFQQLDPPCLVEQGV